MPDVRDGTLDQYAYAVGLGAVAGDVDKPIGRWCRDPEPSKRMTYETGRMWPGTVPESAGTYLPHLDLQILGKGWVIAGGCKFGSRSFYHRFLDKAQVCLPGW